ncbi:hypothetical protein PX52LOC_07504 [Limnoglobus roseus]|uniref:Uncharacterized protein n=1 Tax=Limnoglobus roseus TaxID=2598579 RepID=A0A5C1AN53_9BACT|nr:hypothetical protein PX52LOC_07504 [Limnoglobus roseus]
MSEKPSGDVPLPVLSPIDPETNYDPYVHLRDLERTELSPGLWRVRYGWPWPGHSQLSVQWQKGPLGGLGIALLDGNNHLLALGDAPVGLPWPPTPWPDAECWPIQETVESVQAYLDYAERYITGSEFGKYADEYAPDSRRHGWWPRLQSVRVLAHHFGCPGADARLSEKLPLNRLEGQAEFRPYRDSVVLALRTKCLAQTQGSLVDSNPACISTAIENPEHPLLGLAKRLHIRGNQLKAVEMMVESSCTAVLANYATRFDWTNPADNWNSLRKELNRKFGKSGWRFTTPGGIPTFEFTSASGISDSRLSKG